VITLDRAPGNKALAELLLADGSSLPSGRYDHMRMLLISTESFTVLGTGLWTTSLKRIKSAGLV
jgi:hypothetical protein